MNVVKKYFPNISKKQETQFRELENLYEYWNSRVNLISRKDIGDLYIKHVLHSLSIAKVIHFQKETEIIDVGTGGGFPGIPLAILFPDVRITLIDSINKKVKIVKNIIESISLENVKTKNIRIEKEVDQFDFVISRAVVKMPTFMKWVKKNIKQSHRNTLSNGILYLKGGNLSKELRGISNAQAHLF